MGDFFEVVCCFPLTACQEVPCFMYTRHMYIYIYVCVYKCMHVYTYIYIRFSSSFREWPAKRYLV